MRAAPGRELADRSGTARDVAGKRSPARRRANEWCAAVPDAIAARAQMKKPG